MHIHILGICGTFMGGMSRRSPKQQVIEVSGSRCQCVYPPMSTQLQTSWASRYMDGYDCRRIWIAGTGLSSWSATS